MKKSHIEEYADSKKKITRDYPLGSIWVSMSHQPKRIFEKRKDLWKFIGYSNTGYFPKRRINKPHKYDIPLI